MKIQDAMAKVAQERAGKATQPIELVIAIKRATKEGADEDDMEEDGEEGDGEDMGDSEECCPMCKTPKSDQPPRALTYEMDQKERAAIKSEAAAKGYAHDKMGMPVKK
ncbi:hypothetical protein UFOVP777_20 [uncultured Caudovirales phage]|uniref:Uncharacterized protein n=1 Tax=uncultured Caudovirales phage TaxID=2100421 RepID=A0A6J5NYF6_9CAUD|nr:hypothetical protein UFOVP777_20 [uncultured Caudovirales phage]